jgi:Rieske 2Fe-2S family protein
METFVKPSVGERARTLDARWYISDVVFAQERERIFEREWICVGREEQLEQAGDYFLATIANESLIVVRHGSGAVHAFFNVCRHRGTRLCTADSGHLIGSIQCPYHAWTYALDGALLAARNMQSVGGFDRSEFPLHRAAIAVVDGFIFVTLSPEPGPIELALAPLLAKFRRWNVGGLREVRRSVYDVACNWKLVFQNYSECYHCPVIHPQLEKLSPSDSGRNDCLEGTILGGYSELREQGASLSTTGRMHRPPIGAVDGADLNRDYYYTIFPSMLFSLHPDYVMIHTVRPIAANRSEVVCCWLFDPATIAGVDFDPSDVVDFWDLTNRQDWAVSELTQLGLGSRAYRPGPYSNAEGLLHAFDRHYLSVMEA